MPHDPNRGYCWLKLRGHVLHLYWGKGSYAALITKKEAHMVPCTYTGILDRKVRLHVAVV